MENNKNKKSVKFQGDMLIFCDFIQVFVFTINHHLNKPFTAGVSHRFKTICELFIMIYLCGVLDLCHRLFFHHNFVYAFGTLTIMLHNRKSLS